MSNMVLVQIRIIALCLVLLAGCRNLYSQAAPGSAGPQPEIEKQTFPFAERDSTLYLDFYQLKGDDKVRPLVLFVFGGGFARGNRDHEVYYPYFATLVHNGFKVASIDYRLGLQGIYDQVGVFNTKPLELAIDLAVEDLYAATSHLLSISGELGIDPEGVVVSGSSAGAITSLHADLYQRNRHPLSGALPDTFRFKGVIAFAGAIYSTTGKPEYERQPAPTLLFHGSQDKTVPFDKRRLLNKGFFGSDFLARLFTKAGYPLSYYREIGAGHEIAVDAMHNRLPEVLQFLGTAVLQESEYQLEATLTPLPR